MDNNIILWKKYTEKMLNMFEQGNLSEIDKYKNLADQAYNDYKSQLESENDLYQESVSLGLAHYIVEKNLVNILSSNKNILKEWVELIKNDNNLKHQYKLLNKIYSLENNEYTKEIVKECVEETKSNIDLNTIKESKNKLYNFLSDNILMIEEDVQDKIAMFEMFDALDELLSNKKTLKNINEYVENINIITNYIKENNNKNVDSEKTNITENVETILDRLEESYDKQLNEDERTFVSKIINGDDNTFNQLKEECIDFLDNIINECESHEDKSEYETLKETIEALTYDKGNIVETANKLLEVKTILSEE